VTSFTPSVPPGWYPDHTGAPQLRWWDGAAWTESVRPEEPATALPYASSPYAATATPYSLRPAPRTVPAGTPVYNVFIWIIVLLPIVSIATLLSLDMSSIVSSPSDPTALSRNPAYLAMRGFSLLAYGLTAVLAFFDRRRLLADGFDRPFHWAWAFLGGTVYIIGRSVIVWRRARRGLAVLWVWIGLGVVGFVIVAVKLSALVSAVLPTLPINS
jgi:hypothetical protein